MDSIAAELALGFLPCAQELRIAHHVLPHLGRVDALAVYDLLDRMGKASGIPAVARVERFLLPQPLPYMRVLGCGSETIQEVFENFRVCRDLVGGGFDWVPEQRGTTVELHIVPLRELPEGAFELSALQLASTALMIRTATNHNVTMRASLRSKRRHSIFERLFQSFTLGASTDVIELHADWIRHPLGVRCEPLLGLSQRVSSLQMRHLGAPKSCAERALQLLEATPDVIHLSPAMVAERFKMSSRTLQRYLAQDDYSLDELKDAVLARRALEKIQKMPIFRAAAELGYADERAFRRAFQRWTGCTPQQMREKLEHSRAALW